MKIQKLKDPNKISSLSAFFSKKWNIPISAYEESMRDSLVNECIPSWYYIEENDEIIGGLGIIENDFHKRKDLSPNICAVYIKEAYRLRGYAKSLLDKACEDLINHNIESVYLITAHTSFYEKCGFTYYGDIEENDGNMIRCYFKNLL